MSEVPETPELPGSPAPKVTSRSILDAIRKHIFPQELNGQSMKWAFVEEMRAGPSFAGYGSEDGRSIDLWVMGCWQSCWGPRAIEVKVSRTDFRRELREPAKRAAALRLSERFYFATPSGLVKASELPSEAVFIEVRPDGKAVISVPAPRRECPPPDWRFVASLARKAQRP